jgi:hypothetical protein
MFNREGEREFRMLAADKNEKQGETCNPTKIYAL